VEEVKSDSRKKSFEKIFGKVVLFVLGIASALFLILSRILNEKFFLRFSVDKELTEGVINAVYRFQSFMLAGSVIFLVLALILFYRGASFERFVGKHKSAFQGILLLIVALIFVLWALEIAAIVIVGNEADLPFSLGNFAFESVAVNDEGFRDRNFEIEKPENTVRIVGLGDSFTFGNGIENIDDTYLRVLERELNAASSDKEYEVLNFALPGIDTQKELEILEERALKYEPDIVIVGFYLNDLDSLDPAVGRYKRIGLPVVGFWLDSVSYFYYFLESRTNRIFLSLGWKETYEEYLMRMLQSEVSKEETRRIFRELSEVAKENEFDVVIVNIPVLYKFENYQFLEANELLEEISEENGFYFVDLLDTFGDYEEEEIYISKHNVHMNEFGNRLAGEVIFDKLLNERIIEG